MAGYRSSSFDPNASPRGGAPTRPFNWVQWVGVALIGIGTALLLAMIGADLGVAWLSSFGHAPAVFPILIGNLLIYSRRNPVPDLAPELAAARKRWLLITVAVLAVVLGIAAVITFSGAN